MEARRKVQEDALCCLIVHMVRHKLRFFSQFKFKALTAGGKITLVPFTLRRGKFPGIVLKNQGF